jgi:hypothetical protein
MKFAFAVVFALFLFGCAPTSDQPVDEGTQNDFFILPVDGPSMTPVQPIDIGPPCCPPGECFPEPGNPFAGRYHLRGRTKRFFGRVA